MTFNAKHGTLQGETKAKSMKSIWNLKKCWVKRGRDGIINKAFWKGAGIQDLLKELQEKWLQWFEHEKGMERTRIMRRASELKYERNRLTG
jgi:hypothetical protein